MTKNKPSIEREIEDVLFSVRWHEVDIGEGIESIFSLFEKVVREALEEDFELYLLNEDEVEADPTPITGNEFRKALADQVRLQTRKQRNDEIIQKFREVGLDI